MSRSNNPNGRPAGTTNQITTRIKDRFSSLVEGSFAQLQKDFDSLTSKERLDFLAKLLPFVIPKARDPLESLTEEQLDELFERIIKAHEQNRKAA